MGSPREGCTEKVGEGWGVGREEEEASEHRGPESPRQLQRTLMASGSEA